MPATEITQRPEVLQGERSAESGRRGGPRPSQAPDIMAPEVAPARAPVRPAPDESPKRQEEPSQRRQRSPRERGPLVKEEE